VSSDLTTWWDELSAAAMVGTARRPPPPLPHLFGTGRDGAPREVALLDAAALGGAVRRAGGSSHAAGPASPAQDDLRPVASPRAVQLLELVLHQSPVGAALTPRLVELWLETAEGTGHRVPHHLLPELLDLGTARPAIRPWVRGVGDARGAWLAAVNPVWAWAARDPDTTGTEASPTAHEWARLGTPQRVEEVVRRRSADPAAARRLLESTWSRESVNDRLALVSALRTGLGPDDEPFLERALDDRSAKVREAAASLLDALPTSARAARMAARLRPLLHVKGILRKTLTVELPGEPDAGGRRDGLGGPTRGSARGWWLQRLAAGAPLEVWTEVTGADPDSTWRRITDQDVRVGIVEAVLARGDRDWAVAITGDVWHPGLLALLPADRLDAAATDQLAKATPRQLVRVVDSVPAPWGPGFSQAVLRRLAAEKDARTLLPALTVPLATGLDPMTRPALDTWAATLDDDVRRRLIPISQFLVLLPEIQESFR
jgi:hypothetical protein